MEVLTSKDNNSYLIAYSAEQQDYNKYLSFAQQMIDSFEIINPPLQSVPEGTISEGCIYFPGNCIDTLNGTTTLPSPAGNGTNNFLTYANSTYGIKIRYPANWSYQEFTNLPNSSFINIVELNPPIAADPNAVTYIAVGIQTNFGSNLPLDQITRNVIEGFRGGNYTDFKLISAATDSTLGETPAYSIVFTYTDAISGLHEQMERGAVIGGNLYIIDFNTETLKYNGFLPVVQDIMNSFNFIPQNQSSTSSQLSSQGPVTGTEAVTTPPVSGNNISQLTQAPSLSTSTINETQSTR
jgi:hypothetical protein